MMALARFLNWQGIAGLAAALALAALLLIQKGEARHFRKESARFERLYRDGESIRAQLVTDYSAAAERARAQDRANAARVAGTQDVINRSSLNDFEVRVADARARSERLRSSRLAEDRSPAGNASVPGLSGTSGRLAQGAGQNGLSAEDALTATEQAIQLDALIKWVRAQAAIDPNRNPAQPSD